MRQAEQIAHRLIADLPPCMPVDVTAIAQQHGIIIHRQTFWNTDINGFYCVINKQPIMVINSTHPEVRQRFTMAHELYHHLIYGIHGKPMFAASIDSMGELQANRFAATLLMPPMVFALAYEHTTLKRVADIFGVSVACAQRRAKELNLTKSGAANSVVAGRYSQR